MAELRGMVESGLLEEEDVAEEVGQLKGEAKAWRVSTAASGALVGRAATLQPLQRCRRCSRMRSLPARGRCSPRACCRVHLRQAPLRHCARRWLSPWLYSGEDCNTARSACCGNFYSAPFTTGLSFLKKRSGAARRTLTCFFSMGFLDGGPTLSVRRNRSGAPAPLPTLFAALR